MPILYQDRVFMNMHLTGTNPFVYMLKMGFKNSYLDDKLNHHENCIFLLFNPEKITNDFIEFSEMVLQQHSEYVMDYDVDENKIMFIYNIPNEYREDVNLVKMGKYSITSKRYKDLFPNKIPNKQGQLVLNANWMILHKHPQWKKTMEEKVGAEIPPENDLWDAFNEEKEIFNYEKEMV